MNGNSGRGTWTPLDRPTGMRIGALVGGLLGIGVSLLTGLPAWVCLPLAGIIGGVVGFRLTGPPTTRPGADEGDPR